MMPRQSIFQTLVPHRLFLNILLITFPVLFLGLVPKPALAESYYYYYFGNKQPLTLESNLIVFQRPLAKEEGITHPGLEKFTIYDKDIDPYGVRGWSTAKTHPSLRTEKDLLELLDRLVGDNAVDFVSPVFTDNTWGGEIVLTRDILVGFKDNVASNQAEALLARFFKGIVVNRKWGNMPGVYRLRCASRNGLDVLRMANSLAEQRDIKFAEPVVFFTGWTSLTPNDPGFPDCWGIHNTGQSGGMVDIDMDGPEAWDITTGDPSIIVVVIDNGIQQNHPDIHQRAGTDTTSDGPGTGGPVNQFDNHGTAVAGCVAATINNTLGTVGIAPDCLVASARPHISIDNRHFITNSTWVVDALSWAESIGARVTNNSNAYGFTSSAIASKYEQTRIDGMVHFAAAGNSATSAIAYPANLPTVNSVAALNSNGQLASFSNWGAGLDFSAPGVDIYTTDRTGNDGYSNDDYVFNDGTSFASPYAAGIAGLVLSLNPSLSADDVEQLMRGACVDLGAAGYDTNFGWGLVNMYAIILAAQGHDVEAGLYVPQAGVIHPPGSPVSGEVWATNVGNYTEFGDLEVRLEKQNGEPLASPLTYPFTNLGIDETTTRYSFSLTPTYSYLGSAVVRVRLLRILDENPANNTKSIPVYFSPILNPSDSFDGFQEICLATGEEQIHRGHTFRYEDGTFYVDGEPFSLSGEYVFLSSVVFKYWGVYEGRCCFYLWWPDNLYTFSTQYLTIPCGGTATFEVSRTSGSWLNPDDYTVEFHEGLLPPGWTSSARAEDDRLVVEVQAGHCSGSSTYDGWAHLHKNPVGFGVYQHAFTWMRFQTVSSAPETVIISGPEGRTTTADVDFVWSGSDDTTPASQLQYAWRLDPCEPEFTPWSGDTTKSYPGLGDGNYTFYVKARDLGGTVEDPPASRSFIVATNSEPNRPDNLHPSAEQSGVSVTPILEGSPFADPDSSDTHTKSKFEVRSDVGTYLHPVWDSGELASGAATVQMATGLLFSGSRYCWRCSYSDNHDAWSPSSIETCFTTEGRLNSRDFALFANHWLKTCSEPSSCGSSDADDSGFVDFKDLDIVTEHWLEGAE